MYLVVSETTPNLVVPKPHCMFSQEIFKKILRCGFQLEHLDFIYMGYDLDIRTCKKSPSYCDVQLRVGITTIVTKQSSTAPQIKNSAFPFNKHVTLERFHQQIIAMISVIVKV